MRGARPAVPAGAVTARAPWRARFVQGQLRKRCPAGEGRQPRCPADGAAQAAQEGVQSRGMSVSRGIHPDQQPGATAPGVRSAAPYMARKYRRRAKLANPGAALAAKAGQPHDPPNSTVPVPARAGIFTVITSPTALLPDSGRGGVASGTTVRVPATRKPG